MTVDTAKLRELIAKATGGRWYSEGFVSVDASTGTDHFYGGMVIGDDATIVAQNVMPHNVEFLIEAHNTMTALLDEIERKDAEVARLREALAQARRVIAQDRAALVACHGIDGQIPASDELGTEGLAEYDSVLGVIRTALQSTEPRKG